jgi:predicted HicB family RNase H-like nuclease
MARSRKRLVYTEPELDERIVARAAELGLSINEWMNRVLEHALASKGIKVTYHHKTEVEV